MHAIVVLPDTSVELKLMQIINFYFFPPVDTTTPSLATLCSGACSVSWASPWASLCTTMTCPSWQMLRPQQRELLVVLWVSENEQKSVILVEVC